jgi:uncharacterized sulfatase
VSTILSATRLTQEITTRMHGIDLMPSACGECPLQQRPVFGAIYPNDAYRLGAPSQHVRGRWVRDGDSKLIVPGPADHPVALALYNLRHDPGETTNLAMEPAYEPEVARLRKLLDRWWSATDDQGVTKQ